MNELHPPITTPADYWVAAYSNLWGVPEVRCMAGQPTNPRTCTRHDEHRWCTVCEGYYGVSHTGMHDGGRHGGFGQCVCRPCREDYAGRTTGETRRDRLTANGSAYHPEFPPPSVIR